MPHPEIIRLDESGMAEQIWSLADGPLVFGRDPGEGNVVRFSENMAVVSRQHARIDRGLLFGGWILKDLGSQVGTQVNGMKVTRHRLRHDDTIVIAGVHFKFRDASKQATGEVEVLGGPLKGKHFSLDNGDVPVGRKVTSPNGIRFPEEAVSVSAFHCRLRRKRGKYFVDDVESKNGTLLNGKRVVGSSMISDGDRITLGEVVLKVRVKKA